MVEWSITTDCKSVGLWPSLVRIQPDALKNQLHADFCVGADKFICSRGGFETLEYAARSQALLQKELGEYGTKGVPDPVRVESNQNPSRLF